MHVTPGANQRSYYVGRHRQLLGESTAEISPAPKSPLPRRIPPWPTVGEVPTVRLSAEEISAVRQVVGK